MVLMQMTSSWCRGSLLVVAVLSLGLGASGCKRKSRSAGAPSSDMDRPLPRPMARMDRAPDRPRVNPRPGPRPMALPAGRNPIVPPLVKAKQMPKSAFKATVKRPSYDVLTRLSRDPTLGELRVWGHGTSLGGTRFLAVVVGNVTGGDELRFKLVMMHKPGPKWQLGWAVGLPLTEKSFTPAGGQGAASLFVADYDWDGKPEALVRYRYDTKPQAAVGSTEITVLTILNVDGPRPRIAFHAEYHRKPQASVLPRVKSRLKHVDVNADGHPDLLLTTVTTEEIPQGNGYAKRRSMAFKKYGWDRASDTFKGAPPRAKAPGMKP